MGLRRAMFATLGVALGITAWVAVNSPTSFRAATIYIALGLIVGLGIIAWIKR